LTNFGVGLSLYSALAFCQNRFYWWPLNPVGAAVASVWPIHTIVFSVFLAWICKTTILHYGGIRFYRQMRPFFIGLVMGYFIGDMLVNVVVRNLLDIPRM
jgi:hypothetical protein